MQTEKRIKDVMIGIFDFPHVPYWFSISQAVKIVRVSFLKTKKYPDPMALLVFDEKYNLLGTLTLREILRGLEPRFLSPSGKGQVPEEDLSALSLLWDTMFDKESVALTEKPVSEIMQPISLFVEPDDVIAKAAYMMTKHDFVLLPVLENKRKLAGFVRMLEVFDEVSNSVVKE